MKWSRRKARCGWISSLVLFASVPILLNGCAQSLTIVKPSIEFSIVNLIVMAIVIAVLGPGAFSLDSRMFGRREIVIPPSVRAASTQR
jgi:uncharacterized membrane protein YphA (DoxX/SURF4 family)